MKTELVADLSHLSVYELVAARNLAKAGLKYAHDGNDKQYCIAIKCLDLLIGEYDESLLGDVCTALQRLGHERIYGVITELDT